MVELLVTMVVFIFTIAAASSVFTSLLSQFKQQGKMAETQIESTIGLELLRKDIRHAGFGLPWIIPDAVDYDEADTDAAYAIYNDATTDDPPRAIVSGDARGLISDGTNRSDELVIKATNVAINATAQKWTRLGQIDADNPQGVKRDCISSSLKDSCANSTDCMNSNCFDRYSNNERVIVIAPGGASTRHSLVAIGSTFYTTYNATASFAPADETVRVIYGINNSDDVPIMREDSMPFNRADYYISTSNPPERCAPGTGVLLKSPISHADGQRTGGMPLIDCVADFQVTYWLDAVNNDNIIDLITDDIEGMTAAQIRTELKEVRVYVVAHEGQKDMSYDFSQGDTRTKIDKVDERFTYGSSTAANTVSFVDLSSASVVGGPEFKYYRWKLYSISVTPENLL